MCGRAKPQGQAHLWYPEQGSAPFRLIEESGPHPAQSHLRVLGLVLMHPQVQPEARTQAPPSPQLLRLQEIRPLPFSAQSMWTTRTPCVSKAQEPWSVTCAGL